jgi:hypothetical protein
VGIKKAEVQAKAETTSVWSSLNLNLDLILLHSLRSRLRPNRDEMLLRETDQLLKSRGILDGHIG